LRRRDGIGDTSGITFNDDSLLAGLRVLLISDSLSPVDAGRHVATLALGLQQNGHRVTVAAARDGGLMEELKAAGISVRIAGERLGRRSDLRFSEHVLRVIDESMPNVVHAHMPRSAAVAAQDLDESSVLVLSDHGELTWRIRTTTDLTEAFARADAVISHSYRSRERLLAAGVESTRIQVVHDGVRAPEQPQDIGGAGRGWVLGVVTPLVVQSGVDVFIRAAALLAAQRDRARFVVVGDGPQRGALERLAEQLGIRDRVGFLAPRADLSPVLRRLSVLCVPERTDVTPPAALDAMTLGVPVITSDAAGITERMRDRRHTLVVPAGNAGALAAAMQRLIERRRLARRIAGAARNRALREFSPERMLQGTVDVYRVCLERRVAAEEPELDTVPLGAAVPA